MSTAIEWTDETWNPVTGCTRVSEGCDHCYIERTPPFRINKIGFDKPGIGGTTGMTLHPERLDQSLRWRKPRRVFVNSLSDLFHDDVPEEFIVDVFAAMAVTRRHQYQVLTKRPRRMQALLSSSAFQRAVALQATELMMTTGPYERWQLEIGGGNWRVTKDHPEGGNLWWPPWPIPNVWLGVSVENQNWADRRIPLLLKTPAAVRFLSCEPLLDAVNLVPYLAVGDCVTEYGDPSTQLVNWVIVGGESGPGARPMHPDWARSLRDQCVAAGVPFFLKQWGEYVPSSLPLRINGREVSSYPGAPHVAVGSGSGSSTAMARVGKKRAGRELDGRTWDEFPEATPSSWEDRTRRLSESLIEGQGRA